MLTLAVGLSCSYVLARWSFRIAFKKTLLVWILLVRVLLQITFALPLYILMNDAGLIGTIIPIILAHILVNLPFVVWFMMAFFYGVPEEIEESARIDGASEITIYIGSSCRSCCRVSLRW